MIIIFIELCRIADSLLWIPISSRRTSSIFCIPNIIALLKMESQQLNQNVTAPHRFMSSCYYMVRFQM
ncbi:XXYS1_4_G0025940.mRNA.1.CDS.1 [Saccharomyces cerevisiae]|nr:XXYS1_4_G0025940.mRNA.1.CDS.1 [Saccharomyces cerevisiae]